MPFLAAEIKRPLLYQLHQAAAAVLMHMNVYVLFIRLCFIFSSGQIFILAALVLLPCNVCVSSWHKSLFIRLCFCYIGRFILCKILRIALSD